eukprot:1145824-Pelagomonas_calceolata.AAC.2
MDLTDLCIQLQLLFNPAPLISNVSHDRYFMSQADVLGLANWKFVRTGLVTSTVFASKQVQLSCPHSQAGPYPVSAASIGWSRKKRSLRQPKGTLSFPG